MSRKSYFTDLTDGQWAVLHGVLPNVGSGQHGRRRKGRPRKHDLREILNAVRYQVRSGCPWRDLPPDLPPWETVYAHLRRWRLDGTINRLHDILK